MPVSTVVGSLYVHYEFEFFKQLPYGGIPNKNMLWSVYNNNQTASSNAYTWTNYPPVLAYGRNLGIGFNGGTINIPQNLQGALLAIRGFVQNVSVNFTTTTPSVPTLTNCTAVSTPSYNNLTVGLLNVACPFVTNSAVSNATWEIFVQINPNINANATIAWVGGIGTWPATAPASGLMSQVLEIEVVSLFYNTLT